jgi:hypothetical protein
MGSSLDLLVISGIVILVSVAAIVIIFIRRRRKRAGQRVSEGNVPESKNWERPEVWGVVIAVLALVSSTAIGVAQLMNNQGAQSSGGNGSGRVNYFGQPIAVEGRAASPTDFDAPGITLTKPRDNISFQDAQGIWKTITYRDWNTIVATSKVPQDVYLAIDPATGLNPTATSLRRLQYLVDVNGMEDGEIKFSSLQYLRNSSGTKVLAVALIANGHPTAENVSDLHMTVWNGQRSKRFLNGYFLFEGSPISVPAKTTILTTFLFHERTPMSFPPANTYTNEHFDSQNS